MPSFNLVDLPWIPCSDLQTAPAQGEIGDVGFRLLSLRAVFTQAPQLASISDPSPAVTIALYRLLLAILHRSLDGPHSIAAWKTIWDRTHWDLDRIIAYLDRWYDRFDLFHPQYPFYQTPDLPASAAKSPTLLAHERASARNRALLFDHTPDGTPLAPAEAARYLLAQHCFGTGGMVSLSPGEPVLNKFTSAAPLTGGAVVLLRGETLFHTLMLNLMGYSRDESQPFPFGPGDDKPAWEREDGGAQPEPRLPDGLVDLLTWQSRRILLLPEDPDTDGPSPVRGAILMKGYQFAEGFAHWNAETMLAFRAYPARTARSTTTATADANADADSETPSRFEALWSPLGLNPDRLAWRDSHALFQSVAGEQQRPKVMSWLSTLVASGTLDQREIVSLDVYGLITEQANTRDWRRESLPLPLPLLAEVAAPSQGSPAASSFELLRQALVLAEAVGQLFDVGWVTIPSTRQPALVQAEGSEAGAGAEADQGAGAGAAPEHNSVPMPSPMWTLCDTLLTGLGEHEVRREECVALARSLGAAPRYWSRLDISFRAFLVHLADPPRAIAGGEGAATLSSTATTDPFRSAVKSRGRGMRKEEDEEDSEAITASSAALSLHTWASDIERISRAVFRSIVERLGTSARELRAAAIAEQRFAYQLAALLSPYRPFPRLDPAPDAPARSDRSRRAVAEPATPTPAQVQSHVHPQGVDG